MCEQSGAEYKTEEVFGIIYNISTRHRAERNFQHVRMSPRITRLTQRAQGIDYAKQT